jgi:hypothetical protein
MSLLSSGSDSSKSTKGGGGGGGQMVFQNSYFAQGNINNSGSDTNKSTKSGQMNFPNTYFAQGNINSIPRSTSSTSISGMAGNKMNSQKQQQQQNQLVPIGMGGGGGGGNYQKMLSKAPYVSNNPYFGTSSYVSQPPGAGYMNWGSQFQQQHLPSNVSYGGGYISSTQYQQLSPPSNFLPGMHSRSPGYFNKLPLQKMDNSQLVSSSVSNTLMNNQSSQNYHHNSLLTTVRPYSHFSLSVSNTQENLHHKVKKGGANSKERRCSDTSLSEVIRNSNNNDFRGGLGYGGESSGNVIDGGGGKGDGSNYGGGKVDGLNYGGEESGGDNDRCGGVGGGENSDEDFQHQIIKSNRSLAKDDHKDGMIVYIVFI